MALLVALGFLTLVGVELPLRAQAPNPTSFSATPSTITMPGSVTFCAGGGANMTVDLQYLWNGALIETDSGVTFGANGCLTNLYNNNAFAGNYTYLAIRNSLNGPGGAWTTINTPLTLNPIPSPATITSFTASQNPISSGQCTFLNWSTTNADHGDINGQLVAANGSMQVCPTTSTIYTLTAFNSAGQSTSSSLTLTVNALVNGAGFVSQSVPTSMSAGTSYTVSVTMQNTGTTTWTSSSGYQLGSQNLPNNTTWGLSQVSLGQFESIAPGGTKTFTFTVTAPSTAGNYNFQWRMRQGVNGWFGGSSLNVVVAVNLPPPAPQPTSMSFSPTAVNAGNGGSYTLTVGNGANMSIDFQYTWSGNPGVVSTATNWGPLNASGQRTVTVNHGDAQGTYTYLAIKNTLATQWVTLPAPQPTFTILPPQPTVNSLAIAPGTITPPSTFTMTAGNSGGITADTRSTLNGFAQPDQLGWPTFSTLADGVTGQASILASACTATGNYAFTALRNTILPNKSEASWVAQNGLASMMCPAAARVGSISPSCVPAGAATVLSIAGTSLCGPVTVSSNAAGISFSNSIPAPDFSGTPLTTTVTVSAAVAAGSYPFTITTPCAQAVSSLCVVVNGADYVSQTVPTAMNPGVSYPVSITMKNTGTGTWTASGNYQLGSQNPANNTTWGSSRVSLAAGESVAPGTTKTFSFNVTAPSAPGNYNFQWQMLQNGTQSFGVPTLNVVVTVVMPPTMSALSPNLSSQGQNGISLVINGTNLIGATVSVPTNTGVHVSNVQVVSSTQITGLLDVSTTAPVQTIPLSVSTAGGTAALNFSVTAANPLGQPIVNSITPTTMLVSSTQTFVLSGSHLSTAVVTADPVFGSPMVVVISDSQLQVTVTAGATTPVGTYFFTLFIPNFGNTLARFRVLASNTVPSVESFTPMQPAPGNTYFMQITGNNLNGGQITSDNAGVVVLSNAQILNQSMPADYQMIGGILNVSPSVAIGTVVHITITNGGGASAVVTIQVSPPQTQSSQKNPPPTISTIQIGSVDTLGSTTKILVQAPMVMGGTSFSKQLPKSNRQNFFFCDQSCAAQYVIASVRYGIPFIDCGGQLFDQSCFQKIKLGDVKGVHVGFIGIQVVLLADVFFVTDGLFCYPIPCDAAFGFGVFLTLPNSKSMSYSQTFPLPNFFTENAPAPDCTTNALDCTDNVTVSFLPSDAHFCAKLTNLQIQFLDGLLSGFTTTEACVNDTAGVSGKLFANPTTIYQGGTSLLSWQTGNATQLTIFDNNGTTLLSCVPLGGLAPPTCPVFPELPVTPASDAFYTLIATGITSDGSSDRAQDVASVSVAPPPPVRIGPTIVTIKNGQIRQLVGLNQQCQNAGQFAPGTTFQTVNKSNQDGAGIATVDTNGLLTGRGTPGLVFVHAAQQGNLLPTCLFGNYPVVQVMPMTIYLRFLPATITYMKGAFPNHGLGLKDADVSAIESGAVARVQNLYNNAGANALVTSSPPAGLNVPDASSDGIIVVDIVAIPNVDGTYTTGRLTDKDSVVVGNAPGNHLNWSSAQYGADLIGPRFGVFLNRLALIDSTGLRVSNSQIANAIGNVGAHEVGHNLGMVPNLTLSDVVRKAVRDERFGSLDIAPAFFDGDSGSGTDGGQHNGISGQHVMASATPRDVFLTSTLIFRPNDITYLNIVLPR